MSFLQRLGFRRDPREAALRQQVTALQSALAKCKGVAGRWRRMRGGAFAAVAVVMLPLGFTLGVYREPLGRGIADLLPAGFARTADDADAGYAAYEKGNYAAALRLLRPLAEQGDARAQSAIALMYYQGNGVPRSDSEALQWFRRAAERGNARAQFNLGVMYSEAQGVPQDQAVAAKWYRLAAEQNYPQAQYNLGLWYAQDEGGSPDYVAAHMWFNLAAVRFPPADAQNRNRAIRNRDAVASKMTADQVALAQNLAREWKPK
jgi:Sel1 repeat